MSIDEAKETFLRLRPEIDALKAQIKEKRTELKGACATIYDHLREQGLESMQVGGHLFSLKTTTRIKFTKEDFQALLPNPDDINNYQVTEERGSIKRMRRS